MAHQWLDRYQSGETQEVWADLIALGSAVRDKEHLTPARLVAEETMRRARHNVELIIGRLEKLGYRFSPEGFEEAEPMARMEMMEGLAALLSSQRGNPHIPQSAAQKLFGSLAGITSQMGMFRSSAEAQQKKIDEMRAKPALENPAVWARPDRGVEKELRQLEKEAGGPLPISVRAWYETVGAVNLMGSHPVLNPPEGSDCPDPLVVYPLESVEQYEEDELMLVIAPDDLHKANTSGGDPYMIRLPDAAADAPVLYEWHDTTFVDYLREVFAWGGFPGWSRSKNPPLREIEYLKEGLLTL